MSLAMFSLTVGAEIAYSEAIMQVALDPRPCPMYAP